MRKMRQENIKKFRRSAIKALLPRIILQATENKPIHGYAVMRYISRVYGVNFGPSTIYPQLNELEKIGVLKSEWVWPDEKCGKPRKIYTITDKGQMFLDLTGAVLQEACRSKTVEA